MGDGRWPQGIPSEIDLPQVGFDRALEGAARSYGDRVALWDGDEQVTFAQSYDFAMRIAGALRTAGFGPGDRVAIAAPNSLWVPIAYYGIVCSGATACILNPLLPPAALGELYDDMRVSGLFVSDLSESAIAARGDRMKLTVQLPATATSGGSSDPIDGLVPLASLLASEPWSGERCDPDGVAHLQLTGGTTGKSKGVRVLHRNIIATTFQGAAWKGGSVPAIDSDGVPRLRTLAEAVHRCTDAPGTGVQLHVSPFFHGAGIIGQCAAAVQGTTAVFSGRFDPVQYLRDVERFGVTKMFGVPAVFHALMHARSSCPDVNLESVTNILSGAAPIDTTTLRAVSETFPNAGVIEGYGLSEATTIVTQQVIDPDVVQALGSVGRPIIGTRIEIRDPITLEESTQGEPGEIWVNGPQVTGGYDGDDELTANQFVDDWLRTGDLGHLDDDGNLYIDGRLKDVVIYKGYNIYPAALEEVLAAHPEVLLASVVGAPREDVGQIPVAFVVPTAESSADTQAADRIEAFVAERVAPHQRVRGVRFVPELPMSPVGKILKRDLVEVLVNEAEVQV